MQQNKRNVRVSVIQRRRALKASLSHQSWPTASTQLSFKVLNGSFASPADVKVNFMCYKCVRYVSLYELTYVYGTSLGATYSHTPPMWDCAPQSNYKWTIQVRVCAPHRLTRGLHLTHIHYKCKVYGAYVYVWVCI